MQYYLYGDKNIVEGKKMQIVLDKNCKFNLGDEPEAFEAWFDDSKWEDVTLPHDWSVHLPFSIDYSSGTGYLAGGIGWYRIHINPDKEWKDKQISITFDGVYKNSRVWCNSYYLGERPNGYITFTYDITDFFKFDEENIISVYVDRREIADSRWFTGSGITRKVTLNIEEDVHPLPNGIFFSNPSATSEVAIMQMEGEWINAGKTDYDTTVIYKILDAEGNQKGQIKDSFILKAGETKKQTSQTLLQNPNLWSPENPYLYTLETYVSFGTNKEILADTKHIGVRNFEFDSNKGFSLNGKNYKFKGVCMHHDAGVLGAAVLKEVWYRRLMKLKEMGCNAIRMSHNPHMPELYDLCDTLGFFVMDEAFDEWEGPKNKWSTGHNVYPPKHQGYYVNFHTWGKQDLTDMIRRDRNHPCVIMWSIGNEIDYPNDPYCHPSFRTMTGNNDANKPEAERQYNSKRPDATRLAVLSKYLTDIAHSVDKTHPVTLAAAFPELSAKLGFIDPLDVVGFNYKEHLYAEHHKAFPGKPFLGSENGHTLKQWKAVVDNDYISGQFLWTGIDYLGEAHGWPIHGSGAGLLTIAGFEKTGYYRRQSFWSDRPVIHLVTARERLASKTAWGQAFDNPIDCEFAEVRESWNYLPDEKIIVKAYTNLDKAEFILNGRSLGELEKDADKDCILITIPFEEGKLEVKGLDEKGEVMATDSLVTTKAASQIVIKEYKVPEKFFTKYHQFEVTVCDSDGNRVESDSTLLHVKVENGKLIGIENGDLADVTEYTSPARHAYKGQAIVYAEALDENTPVVIKVNEF